MDIVKGFIFFILAGAVAASDTLTGYMNEGTESLTSIELATLILSSVGAGGVALTAYLTQADKHKGGTK